LGAEAGQRVRRVELNALNADVLRRSLRSAIERLRWGEPLSVYRFPP